MTSRLRTGTRARRWLVATLALGMLASLLAYCRSLRRAGIETFADGYESEGEAPSALRPEFSGKDAERSRVDIALREVATGFSQPTDVKFVPGHPELMVVLEKGGAMHWFSRADGSRGRLLALDVLTVSEQGLLGVAFHPSFSDNGKLYLNATVDSDEGDVSEISAWRVEDPARFPESKPSRERTLLRVQQPYQNHNAGQLQFGPDGYLYVGFGDGGHRGDPHGNGQDTSTLLGAMLRIDVDDASGSGSGERAYGVPQDNPFVDKPGFRPEIWAYGLRNPWRYSFDPAGRLVVADVGQNAWEEIDVVRAGDNLGWNIMEGRHCYDDHERCGRARTVPPIYEYSHDEGKSITGGHVYTGAAVPDLSGLYVFGDFVSGRLWALKLPDEAGDRSAAPQVRALGKWDLMPVTMAVDRAGELFIADYGSGTIYRIAAPRPPPQDDDGGAPE